jgi:hypothetical protein
MPEATTLEYKHVVFRKPKCSATEKSGVDCVRNVERCFVHVIIYGQEPHYFLRCFVDNLPPDFSTAENYGLRNTTCLFSKDAASESSHLGAAAKRQESATPSLFPHNQVASLDFL